MNTMEVQKKWAERDARQNARLSEVQSNDLLDAARDVLASAEHIDGDDHKTLVCVDALTRLAVAYNNSITGG